MSTRLDRHIAYVRTRLMLARFAEYVSWALFIVAVAVILAVVVARSTGYQVPYPGYALLIAAGVAAVAALVVAVVRQPTSLTVYLAGLLVGNFIGRTAWRALEVAVMKVPFVRAIYPAVKQVTDFVLAERSGQFQSSRVVAVQPHEKGIWSIGLVTGAGLRGLEKGTGGREMVTVFVPSSPTAFSGYVLVVPREEVVELPMTVEEAMRLLVSGGVIVPGLTGKPAPMGAKPVATVPSPEVAPGVPNVGRA